MATDSGGYREARYVARYLARADADLAALPDGPLKQSMTEVANALAERFGMPKLGEIVPGDLLGDARTEMFDRLSEAKAEPFMPMDDAQAEIFMRGFPFSLDTLADFSAECVHEFMPSANGRPRIAIAQSFHACGIWKGFVASGFRR